MTDVSAYTMTLCEGDTSTGTVVVEVTADEASGPYEVILWGSVTGHRGDFNLGAGFGPGLFLWEHNGEPGTYTYGATVRFTDGRESSTGAPLTADLECSPPPVVETSVPMPTVPGTISDGGPTPPPNTAPTPVTNPPVPGVVYCPTLPNETPVAYVDVCGPHPTAPETFIGTATSIVATTAPPARLPATGAGDYAMVASGAGALVVLGILAVAIGRGWSPKRNRTAR